MSPAYETTWTAATSATNDPHGPYALSSTHLIGANDSVTDLVGEAVDAMTGAGFLDDETTSLTLTITIASKGASS